MHRASAYVRVIAGALVYRMKIKALHFSLYVVSYRPTGDF